LIGNFRAKFGFPFLFLVVASHLRTEG
jgi:hypothetical protein